MMRVLGGVALAVFILLPLVQAVLLSFTVTLEKDGVAAGAVGLMNYADVLAAPELRAAMVNSAVYVCLNVALCIGVGLPAAYALARFRFLGDRHFLLAMLVFRMTPPVVLSLPIFILLFFFRHLVPMIAPGIGVAAFFCFIFSWVEVVFARILTVTAGKPITMAINAMFTFQTDIGMVMAMTCLSLVPGVAMIWLVRNHLARGFTLRA